MEQFGKFRFRPIILAFQIWMYIVNSSLYCTRLGIGLIWVQRRRHWSGIGPALYRVSRLIRFRLLGGPRDSVILSGGRGGEGVAKHTTPPLPRLRTYS